MFIFNQKIDSSVGVTAPADSCRLNIEPDLISPADIDETPTRAENTQLRAAFGAAKGGACGAIAVGSPEPPPFVLAGDTVVAVGRRILPRRPELPHCLTLSGRRHRVYGGVALALPDGRIKPASCKAWSSSAG